MGPGKIILYRIQKPSLDEARSPVFIHLCDDGIVAGNNGGNQFLAELPIVALIGGGDMEIGIELFELPHKIVQGRCVLRAAHGMPKLYFDPGVVGAILSAVASR